MSRSRNPWHGCNRPWPEFKHDVTHPRDFARDGWDGMRGRNGIPPEHRAIAFGFLVLGALQIALGLTILLG